MCCQRILAIACAALLLLGAAGAQCTPGSIQLTTTFVSNNGQAGNMFDITAINDVTICTFDVNLGPGSWDMEVYRVTGGGTFVGNETNSGAWTMICSVTVVSNGTDMPTFLPCSLGVSIPAGNQQGFYVTTTNGAGMNYTNGTVTNSDANISVDDGTGNVYPFGATFMPRIWNGNVCYTPGLGACTGTPYQQNQPVSRTDFDGVLNNGFLPAVSITCLGGNSSFTAATATPGAPFDFLVCLGSLIPSPPGPVTPGGQRVNVELGAPGCFFFNSLGPLPALQPHPGSVVIPISCATPTTLSAQQLVINGAVLDGFSLSQGSELVCLAGGGATVSGPVGDDAFVRIDLTNPPICANSVPFFGTAYTELFVISNGRVQFLGPDPDHSPTVAEAQTDDPFVGAWVDLDPSAGGTVTTSFAGGAVTVGFAAVPYFGTTTQNTFSISFDTAGGAVVLDGLSGMAPGPTVYLGLSGGNVVGATAPPPVTYATGAGSTSSATDMIYEFGPAPFGVNTITYLPNAASNYNWTSQ